MKKILITGAAGFIGSHLIDHLLHDKQSIDSLRLLVAPWDTLENLPPKPFEVFVGDIRDKNIAVKAMQDIEVVYHLASKTGYDGGDYTYFQDTIVEGTKHLLAAAKKEKIKKFIFFSSSGVYGLPATAGNIRNYNEKRERTYSEAYGQSKYEAENLIMNANKEWGLNYIIIRPATVYGPRDKAGIYQLIRAIKSGIFFFIGNGKNKMDYVYVLDVVHVARSLEKSQITNEDFIVGSGNPLTLKEIVKTISKRLGKSEPRIYIPILIALSMSFLIKYISLAFGIKPIFFPNRVKVLSSDYYFDIQKLKKAISFRPKTSFKDGIDETISWLITHQKLL